MRKNKTPHHFYSEIYYQNFYFCNGWTFAEFKSYFDFDIDDSAKGTTLLTNNGIIIWVDSNNLGALCHESVHAANFLFTMKGIRASNKNDEPLAYLTQWIFDNCLKKMKFKK